MGAVRGAARGKPARPARANARRSVPGKTLAEKLHPEGGRKTATPGHCEPEDKVVQRAVVEVLNAIYETDFLGFSYGFRPGRGPHDAPDALSVGIWRKKGNWVLDADMRDFFGQLDRSWLRKFLGHRIADKRVLRPVDQWLAAGVIEAGQWPAAQPCA